MKIQDYLTIIITVLALTVGFLIGSETSKQPIEPWPDLCVEIVSVDVIDDPMEDFTGYHIQYADGTGYFFEDEINPFKPVKTYEF